jgi:predicted O-methyltransferase YrrM
MKHILENIPDKRQNKNTTSLKFKTDIIDYFKDLNLNRCIEVGTSQGYSTRVLSFLFNEVITLENNIDCIHHAINFNSDRTNITYLHGDVYNSDWDVTSVDAAFIDCVHTYDAVMYDIKQSLKRNAKYLIFDDYGLPESVPSVKAAVDEFIKNNPGVKVTHIGEPKGSEPRLGRQLIDWEGIIICMI